MTVKRIREVAQVIAAAQIFTARARSAAKVQTTRPAEKMGHVDVKSEGRPETRR
ncbi:hypothetical protein M407DRAFT_244105 [Tulasnella calospora MUT 4182]|uniref:Uncharacterized protein n=1 Tax=Tulasnella calospora MUT 4182 TaxID=1051891 RepID=A0A0C3KVE1_9AGAM|nr:hypothetical protein M407DRAFT_244105 [Tulasnella calospora MUT 4182]